MSIGARCRVSTAIALAAGGRCSLSFLTMVSCAMNRLPLVIEQPSEPTWSRFGGRVWTMRSALCHLVNLSTLPVPSTIFGAICVLYLVGDTFARR